MVTKKVYKKSEKQLDEVIDWWSKYLHKNEGDKTIDWRERCETLLDNVTYCLPSIVKLDLPVKDD